MIKEQELIGRGADYNVYIQKSNPDKVIKASHEHALIEDNLDIRGRYYLTKIAHYLLPDFIPDVNLIARKNNTTTIHAQRIYADSNYIKMCKLRLDKDNPDATQQFQDMYEKYKDKVNTHSRVKENNQKLKEFGLDKFYDTSAINIAFDEANNPFYIDQFIQWKVDFYGNITSPNLEKIKSAIEKNLEGKKQKIALRFLNRYVVLLNKKKENLIKK